MEAIDYCRKILKMIFPLKSSPEIEKFKKGLQSENGEAKAQGPLEYGESDDISFELF